VDPAIEFLLDCYRSQSYARRAMSKSIQERLRSSWDPTGLPFPERAIDGLRLSE